MSRYPCTTTGCPQLSRVLCYCCKNNYCIEHLKDHNDIYLSQLHQLANEINKLSEYFRGQYRQQLDRWRHESHQAIDSYYEKKCEELDNKSTQNEIVTRNRQAIERIKINITQLIREHNTTQEEIDSLKAAISAIQRETKQISKENFELNIPPLTFDENFIRIENKQPSFNLNATIKTVFLSKNISSENSIILANNSKYLLILEETNLCLYDKYLNRIAKIAWKYGTIWDMCMSNNLLKFILATDKGLFTLDDRTMIIEQVKALSIINESWYCCACLGESLFLTKQSNAIIYEYIASEDKFQLKREQSCYLSNEYIEHMKSGNNSLALIVLNGTTGERRLDIRSMLTFDQLWTISLNTNEKDNNLSCCSLHGNGWLIVDLVQTRLTHINSQGQVKKVVKYKPSPHYAVLFGTDILALLTEEGIYLHKIK